jgi:hypothetical protein
MNCPPQAAGYRRESIELAASGGVLDPRRINQPGRQLRGRIYLCAKARWLTSYIAWATMWLLHFRHL